MPVLHNRQNTNCVKQGPHTPSDSVNWGFPWSKNELFKLRDEIWMSQPTTGLTGLQKQNSSACNAAADAQNERRQDTEIKISIKNAKQTIFKWSTTPYLYVLQYVSSAVLG